MATNKQITLKKVLGVAEKTKSQNDEDTLTGAMHALKTLLGVAGADVLNYPDASIESHFGDAIMVFNGLISKYWGETIEVKADGLPIHKEKTMSKLMHAMQALKRLNVVINDTVLPKMKADMLTRTKNFGNIILQVRSLVNQWNPPQSSWAEEMEKMDHLQQKKKERVVERMRLKDAKRKYATVFRKLDKLN